MNHETAVKVISATGLLAALILFFIPAIPQDSNYHHFADSRGWMGVPNFGNVLSNLPFVGVGFLGLLAVWKDRNDKNRFILPAEGQLFALAFIGIGLVAPGSAYYHWNPNNDTLLWDRLPMTIGFMAIFSLMILERIHVKAGLYLLPLFLLLGVWSVLYWHHTETLGHGDLRPYAWVQFFPTLAIPMMLLMFPPRYSAVRHLWWMVAWYALAKVLEHFDGGVFALLGGTVSGHSLKHVAAAWGTYELLRYMKNRQRIQAG